MLADVTTGSIYDSGAAVPVRAWGGVCVVTSKMVFKISKISIKNQL